MAGNPLCCQQRPVPRTLRWHGVPFFVRAPQIEIISFGSVGRSPRVPFGPKPGSGCGASASDAGAVSVCCSSALVAIGRGGICVRSTIKGGGRERTALPAARPSRKRQRPASKGETSCALRKRREQVGQNRRLCHMRQRVRETGSPHSAQEVATWCRMRKLEEIGCNSKGSRQRKHHVEAV